MSNTSHRCAVALTCLIAAALLAVVSGCGAPSNPGRSESHTVEDSAATPIEWAFPPRPIAGLRQRTVGDGVGADVLLWEAGRRRPPRDVVVFLHGYEPLPPWTYGYWLRHLAAEGNAIVYPVYQEPSTPPERYRSGALNGIAAGRRLLVIAGPGDLIPAGESQARGLLAGARRVPPRLRTLRRPTEARRYSPQEDDRRARRFFWRPVDRLIAATRGDAR